jgi:diacylglycerol kinase (ATP)
MNPGTHRKVLAIVNPVSGQHHPDGTCKLIEEAAAQQQIDLEIRLTEGGGDALRWAQAASAEGFDLLLVSGGDGTVMEAMSGLIKSGSRLPLAQIPTGTANFLARALLIPVNVEESLEVLFSGKEQRLIKTLDGRGFRFVGPTVCHAFMQSGGLLNDHTVDCFRYAELTR